jgi:AraC family transcriptional regulator
MLRQYNLLDNVLIDIEKGVKQGIYLNTLAEKHALSEGHLRRLFRFAFKQTLGSYIRSRKLAASLDDLQKKDINILDVALEYGFEYEQSYRRAFKHEFGITPGKYRKAGHIVKIKPPLHLFDDNEFANGLLQ